MLKCYSGEVYGLEPVHANEASVEKFRSDIITGLGSKNAHFAINFHRTELGETGGGHWSPVMAYNKDHDMVLLVDVARYIIRDLFIA
jgi:hypothetical protein